MTPRLHLINRIAEIEADLRHRVRSARETRALQDERQRKLDALRRMPCPRASVVATPARHD